MKGESLTGGRKYAPKGNGKDEKEKKDGKGEHQKGETSMQNAIIIDAKDNVAVAIEPISKGDLVSYVVNGQEITLTAQQDITIYHKLACRDIAKGEPVVKYGEHIGIAGCDIKAGEHVHVHNVEDHREDLGAEE